MFVNAVSATIVLVYIFLGGLTSAIYNEVLQFFIIVAALLLLGGDIGGGRQIGVTTLVDLRTGQVVWFNYLARQTGDLRDEAGARAALAHGELQRRQQRVGRLHRVERHLHVAVGRVLEADRHRQPAGHFPVRLARWHGEQ